MSRARFPVHGWAGVALVAVFWPVNWILDGPRTHWAFFPLWLGYCLTVDGSCVARRGTSLLTRSVTRYAGLFAISIPIWWLFEAVNLRTQNWSYLGRELFSDLEYALLCSLAFSTVVPAVLGTAELVAGFHAVKRFRSGRPRGLTVPSLTVSGLVMLALVLAWPRLFYPLVWICFFLLLEAVNLGRGYRSITSWTRSGDYRAVAALGAGVLVCGFFWEMWNFWSYPKWIYTVPGAQFLHVFEMPLLGYLGYVPFALEIFAAVHLAFGLAGHGRSEYVTRGLVTE